MFFLCVPPAIILFGIAKTGLGGSVSLISIPLMTIVMPLTEALALILPILIFSDIIAVYKIRKKFDFPILQLIVPFAVIGLIIGFLTFSFFSENFLKLFLGIMGFLFSSHYFLFRSYTISPSKPNFLKGATCASLAGLTSFCAHAGGTPASLYLLPLRLKKEIYVGTRVIFFCIINFFKLPLYIYLSMLDLSTFLRSTTLFPLALAGIYLGYRILELLDENLFYKIVYVLILVSSTKLIIDYF